MSSIEFLFYEHPRGLGQQASAAPIIQVHCSACDHNTCIDLRVAALLSQEHRQARQICSMLRCGRCGSSRVCIRSMIGAPSRNPIHSSAMNIEASFGGGFSTHDDSRVERDVATNRCLTE